MLGCSFKTLNFQVYKNTEQVKLTKMGNKVKKIGTGKIQPLKSKIDLIATEKI